MSDNCEEFRACTRTIRNHWKHVGLSTEHDQDPRAPARRYRLRKSMKNLLERRDRRYNSNKTLWEDTVHPKNEKYIICTDDWMIHTVCGEVGNQIFWHENTNILVWEHTTQNITNELGKAQIATCILSTWQSCARQKTNWRALGFLYFNVQVT